MLRIVTNVDHNIHKLFEFVKANKKIHENAEMTERIQHIARNLFRVKNPEILANSKIVLGNILPEDFVNADVGVAIHHIKTMHKQKGLVRSRGRPKRNIFKLQEDKEFRKPSILSSPKNS